MHRSVRWFSSLGSQVSPTSRPARPTLRYLSTSRSAGGRKEGVEANADAARGSQKLEAKLGETGLEGPAEP